MLVVTNLQYQNIIVHYVCESAQERKCLMATQCARIHFFVPRRRGSKATHNKKTLLNFTKRIHATETCDNAWSHTDIKTSK